MRTATYRRVSTDMQYEEGYSLEAQKLRLDAYALSQGWTVVDDYCDEGYSAKNTERPALQRLLNDIRNKKIDVVLVYRLDRFVRNVQDLHAMLQIMDQNDVKFKSATEVFDTTSAIGRLFITLVAAIAQWERETISERVHDTLIKRAEQGLWNGGAVPLGYNLQDGNLIINEEEAKIVKYIFNSYLSKGMGAIAKELNTIGAKTKNNGRFSQKSIQRIIKNPIYIGKVRWNNHTWKNGKLVKTNEEIIVPIAQDDFKPIIDQELFERANSLISGRVKNKYKGDNDYLFSRVLTCNRCGTRLISHKRKRIGGNYYRYYTCRERDHFGTCDMPAVSEISVEKEFLKLLTIKDYHIESEENESNQDDLNKELEKISRKKERIKELYLDGDISKSEYTKRIEDVNEIEEKITSKLSLQKESATKQEMINIVEQIKEYWDVLSRENKKQAIQTVVSNITVEVLKSGQSNPTNPEDRYSKIEIKNIDFS